MGSGPLCEGCALERLGTGFTAVEVGARYEQTRLLLVGEASGENEARESLPFRPYAQAGSMLAKALNETRVSRAEIAITNVIRCRPPKDWLEGAPWQYGAISHCTGNYLKSVIEELKPRAILALGGTAYRTLVAAPKGKYGALDFARGFVSRGGGVAEGIPVIATYHPAFIRRGASHLTSLVNRDIRRAFLVATGKLKEGEHFYLDLDRAPLRYETAPILARAWEFANSIDPDLPLYWDCETPRTTRETEDEFTSFTDREMKLFQATQHKGEGIALPVRDEFIDVMKAILATPTLKVTQNGWNFDEPVAKGNGVEINLEKGSDDLMVMFGRVEPDLPANLQAIAQYCGFPFPWKSLGETDIAFYGVADVDALAWCYPVLKSVMERDGLWEPYVTYFRDYHPILRKMAERGVPISEPKRIELKELIEREELEVDVKIRALVPAEVLGQKQKMGYKNPPILNCEDCDYKGRGDHICSDLTSFSYVTLAEINGLVLREVTLTEPTGCRCTKKTRSVCDACAGSGVIPAGVSEFRWATPVEFNPNSSHQVKKFMRFLKHPVPKHGKRTDERTGEASETTEVKELERLFTKTKHPIYPMLIEKRQLSKLMGTYVEGWKPGRDGRIHATFSHKATWQPSSKSPNIFNGIKRGRTPEQKARVKAFNGMQCAESGHLFVNLDFKSFHAQTMACEVGNADYLRLTKLDQHSFVTCHGTKHPERFNLLKWSDADLKAFFTELRADKTPRYKGPSGLMTFKEARDGKFKSCIAEGELVLTENGLKPIQNVMLADRVWDGVEWVHHEGLIDQGIREVITYQGLTATPDHEVFTLRGSKTLLEAARQLDRLVQTGSQGEAIRTSGDYQFEDASRRQTRSGANSMCDLQEEKHSRLSLSEVGTWERMPELRADEVSLSGGVGSEVRRDHFAVLESTKSGVSSLRREGDQVSLRLPQWVRTVCGEDVASRFIPWSRDRSDQQRRALRARESETSNKRPEPSESSMYSMGADSARKGSADGMGFTLRSALDGQIIAERVIWRADCRTGSTDGSNSALQELETPQGVVGRARVYDLLNAGPRHRFTVSGVLVHNCGLGVGFGMQGRKLYQMYQEDFINESEAKMISHLLQDELFDGAIGKWQKKIKAQAAEDGFLMSRYGAIRRFYDVERWSPRDQRMMGGDQAEAAIAFLPAANAFGYIRAVQLKADGLGYLDRWEMVNSIYDSIQLHPLAGDVEECIRAISPLMEEPSRELVYLVCPGGLSVEAEASVGPDLAHMEEV